MYIYLLEHSFCIFQNVVIWVTKTGPRLKLILNNYIFHNNDFFERTLAPNIKVKVGLQGATDFLLY